MLFENRYYSKALLPQGGAAQKPSGLSYTESATQRIHSGSEPKLSAWEKASTLSLSPSPSQTEIGKHRLTFDTPPSELQSSMRGKMVAAALAEPQRADPMAVERAMLDVREKSSYNLRSAFAQPEELARMNALGRPTTRTSMMVMRREAMNADNARIGHGRETILPKGVQPGAPGKRPDATRFTYADVECRRPVRGR